MKPTINIVGSAPLAGAVAIALTAIACASERAPTPPPSAAPALTSACDAQAKEFFRTELWEPVLSVRCVGCHNANGLAGGTHLVLVPDSEPNAIDQNYATVSSVARLSYQGTPLLLLRPEGLYPGGHAGGTLIPKGSHDYAKLKAFVDTASSGSCDELAQVECDPTKATSGHRALRRLTNFEYDNTLRDLLGITPKWGALFPPDDVQDGFDDIASALHTAPIYTDKARAAAEDVAGSVDLATLLPCPVATGDDACARSFVTTFGARAFRRPLSDAEVARYAGLAKTVAASEGFEGGVRAVVTAMLQSPNFLYRTEIGEPAAGGAYALTQHEVASELSYLLTESMPDAPLLADAASGALSRPETLTGHATRLLQSDAGRAALTHFADQWLLLNRLSIAVKDPSVYPEFTPALADAMHAETLAYFVSTMRASGATFAALFTGTTTYAGDALAQFYGLAAPTGPADSNGLKAYAMPSGRVGLLTQAAILATQAKPDRPSPVLRGELVRVQLLCQALPPPPAGVNTQLPPVDPNVPNRQRFTAHSQNQPCQSCHQLMDPIGFGFEGFDGIGRPVSGSIDTSGRIVGTDATNGTFNGTGELASLLAKSPDAQGCFALEWYRYAYGLDDATDDSCGASKLVADFQAGGLSLSGLVTALVQAPHFTTRLPDVDDGAPVPPPPVDDAGPIDASLPVVSAADAGAKAPTAGSNVTVDVQQQSSWATGYCNDVTVTNTTSAAIPWTVALPAQGTLSNVWNATESDQDGQWVFTGEPYNTPVAAGGTTAFGFCASM